jgi:5-methylthioadenosine/S-adenosylhomocysteine deaminase
MRILVQAKYVITLDPQNPMVEDGALIIENGRITAIGPKADLAQGGGFDEVIGSSEDEVAMPGLVNAHLHVGRAYRNFAPDLPIEMGFVNLREGLRPRMSDEDLYWNVAYSAVEYIRRGITTVLDHHPGLSKGHFVTHDAVLPAMSAYEDSGMRVSLAYGVTNQNRFAYEDDRKFLQRLPEGLAAEAAARLKPFDLDEYYRNWQLVYDRYHGKHDRMKVLFGPMNVQWCSDDLLTSLKRRAADRQTGVHIHLAETPYQLLYAEKTWGRNTTLYEHLDDIGFLGPEVSIAHSIWTKERDWRIAGDSGVNVVSCMASNFRMGNGIFPLLDYLAHGAHVAFGTDGRGLNDDNDILQDLRLFMFSQRLHGISAPRISGKRILELCVGGGARAALWETQTGALKIGKQADVILLSMKRAFHTPYVSRNHDPAEVIMHRASGHDVTGSIIAGRIVMKEGKVLTLDEKLVEKRILEMWDRYQAATGQDRAFANEMIPHVHRFFREWDADLDRSLPHNYRYNIR